MDFQTWSIVISLLTVGAGLIWHASRIKATVDTHGNAIGEQKRKLDAHEMALHEHHGRISNLEGRNG